MRETHGGALGQSMRKHIFAGSDRVRLEGVQRDALPLGRPNEVWHEGCLRAFEEMREAAWSGDLP